MDRSKRLTGKRESEPPSQPPSDPTTKPLNLLTAADLLPALPNYDPEPADGVHVGESPVPGLTLRRILRGHTGRINRIAWSPDGRLLASPSDDKTIRIWNVARGECMAVLEHTGAVNGVAWSPDGGRLASGFNDRTIRIWDVAHGKCTAVLKGHEDSVFSVAWSPDGRRLASGSGDDTICVWDEETWKKPILLKGHTFRVVSLAWSSDGRELASGSMDATSCLWNPRLGEVIWKTKHPGSIYSVAWMPNYPILVLGGETQSLQIVDGQTGKVIQQLEGHTGAIHSISFSNNGILMGSKASDGVRLWQVKNWTTVAILNETAAGFWPPSLAFHPHLPRLATLGEKETIIRIWDIDMDVLLGQTATDSIRYTTAKLVLVGDSGVGKTGLGWRLAHGEFKEQSSTHGQQFWVIDELGKTREDGTECEAVLWDLAGQAIYRHGHPLFLENVDLSLLLFDPTKGMDSLNGVEFWINQLAGKTKLPPSILVGARVDVGDSILTEEELRQFCQRYGISEGYVRTSAKKDIGLDALLSMLQSAIPWDSMTTTVTTVTFKRIKDYVLTLKEQPERTNVLVNPSELRQQIEEAWQTGAKPFDEVLDDEERPDWDFTDAEMMTAVGHLENHGITTILRTSAGAQIVLLAPELLVNLVSSIILQANRHPRDLGSLNETTLRKGGYPFAELETLSQTERETLSDAAILRFLGHNICFRETLGAETLLIFPGLIRQKRPLYDDIETADDVSYIVRGAVENVYAALVVLLGYTQTFTRVNQWQNQAQYEMGPGEICGFRQIEERAGEIELILYYAATTPGYARTMFQGMFEKFLYQRDVDVTRYPPVRCVNGHLQERATVIKQLNQGKDFIFCPECGEKVALPKVTEPQALGERDRETVARAENLAQLRRTYELHLSNVKGFRRDRTAPRCYVSHMPAQASWVECLIADLREAGVYIVSEVAQVADEDFVLLVATPAYKQACQQLDSVLADDWPLIQSRLKPKHTQRSNLIPLLFEGDLGSARLRELRGVQTGDFRDETRYVVALYDLVLTLYAIPFSHPAFKPLREHLLEQWERTLKQASTEDDVEAAQVQETKIEDEIQGGILVTEQYVDFDLHIAPDGHAVASSSEGEASTEISLDVPNTIDLVLSLIEAQQTNAKLLKQVGQVFYNWLFPGPIHTHFHQTEAIARAKETKMRIRLRIEAEEIASLPLEFIYRETAGYFMAINPSTVLSRYLALPMPPGFVRRREGPLHMLAIIADPTDQTRLPPDEWEAIIGEALAILLDSGQMTLQTVKRATRKEIRNALLQQKPDIIQFVGHGIYKDGKGYLALVDEKTDETWHVDDETFANLYMGYDDHLGLISLATCESAKSDDPQGFLGIAPRLVQHGIPAVVAMQYKVLIKTAQIFLEDFYTAVAAHKPIDWAIQSARNAVSQELGLDNREFATPVLYMRAKDGKVF